MAQICKKSTVFDAGSLGKTVTLNRAVAFLRENKSDKGGTALNRNPTSIKDALLRWCQIKTKGYDVIKNCSEFACFMNKLK